MNKSKPCVTTFNVKRSLLRNLSTPNLLRKLANITVPMSENIQKNKIER